MVLWSRSGSADKVGGPMNKLRLAGLTLTAAMALTLGACGSSASSHAASDGTTAPTAAVPSTTAAPTSTTVAHPTTTTRSTASHINSAATDQLNSDLATLESLLNATSTDVANGKKDS